MTSKKVRRFHQARWDEPIIFELSVPGQRGLMIPAAEDEVVDKVGDGLSQIPPEMRRAGAPALPEMGQLQVLRHFNHLSQENLGVDGNVDIGQGTCTMKYSPKINDQFAASPKLAEMHPYQDESTAQGLLEIMYRLGGFFKEISGLDAFSVQPGGGSHGILAMISMVRTFHRDRGEDDQRSEVITTLFSHPSDAAVPKVKGYDVIILQPDANGTPDLEAFKAALSRKTAAILFTNPEDTGIYITRIEEFTRLAHEAGAVCCYDQANGNGLMGITRAREADFDISFFNLHKTFGSPHACGGPATGLVAAKAHLRDFLPVPIVEYDEKAGRYYLEYELPRSCGRIKDFHGTIPVLVRAYAWIMSLGAEGLEEVSRVAIINNNYFMKKMLAIRGCSMSFPDHAARIEQVRYSLEQLKRETGFGTGDVQRRIADFGKHWWGSHEPFVIPEPVTIEPSESYSKADLDEYLATIEQIVDECHDDPETVRHAPHHSVIHHIDHDYLDDPEKWALSWRMYKNRYHGYFEKKQA